MRTELALLGGVGWRGREITGRRLPGLLALLARDLRVGCPTGRLVDDLWGDEPPANPVKAVQVLVSRARAQLGADTIASTPTGYRLTLAEDLVDAAAVLVHAAASERQARDGDHEGALAHAEAGLAYWAGPPEVGGDYADPLAALRADRALTYRALRRSRALALSGLGRHAEAVEGLVEAVDRRPRDEEALAALLASEAATVGPAAALARYAEYRAALRAELGSDPGPTLQAAHRQLLLGQAPPVRHGVAHEPNPLLGRDTDRSAVLALLRTSRVVSIVGTGGLGKTRLAHAVAGRAPERTVHFVPLAGVTVATEVAGEVAAALGVGETGDGQVGRIVRALAGGPALLVLDNCEQVVGGVADLVRALVAMASDLRVLTTSRAPLGLTSEAVYLLPELSPANMVELFIQRAAAARPDVDLPPDAVARVCARLDGLPLAAELAAARVRVLSVAELADRLRDRFALLRGNARDAPARHHALHAVVDWSWHLLAPDGQAAMRALSVFPGGFTSAAARHLLGDDAVLEHLVDQSLLKATDTRSGIRFRMLETVREFSAAQRDGDAQVEADFLAWARDFGLARHGDVFGTEDLPLDMAKLRAERDNLNHALRLAMDRADAATVTAVAAVLIGLGTIETDYGRSLAVAEETSPVLTAFRPGPEFVEVTRTALTLGTLTQFAVYGPRATRLLVALRRLPPAPPTTLVRSMAVVLRGIRELLAPDGNALRAMCASDAPMLAAVANSLAGHVAEYRGDLPGAIEATTRMLAASDNAWNQLFGHFALGNMLLRVDRAQDALRHLAAAQAVHEELGVPPETARIRWGFVVANLQLGATDEAEYWLAGIAPVWALETGDTHLVVAALRAEILLAKGAIEAGLRQWRSAVEPHDDAHAARPTPTDLELAAAAVVAHAQHGRLDQVADTVARLPQWLAGLLDNPPVNPPPHELDLPVCGSLLLAAAMVAVDRGEAVRAVRLIALAERLDYRRTFQPTMAVATARAIAERTDPDSYAQARLAYAVLNPDELRAAAARLVHRNRAGRSLLGRPQPSVG